MLILLGILVLFVILSIIPEFAALIITTVLSLCVLFGIAMLLWAIHPLALFVGAIVGAVVIVKSSHWLNKRRENKGK